MVVMEDCDVERTIAAMMTSFFGNAGQRCLAAANCVVVGNSKDFYQDFISRVVARAAAIRVGNGLDESVQMGPLRDQAKKRNVLRYIELGLSEGAKLLLDGRKASILGDYPEACFLGPSIFEHVEPGSRLGSEEIFGPVMSIMRAGSLRQAIDMANANPFGNGHSIFTRDGRSAREFQYNIESGNVGINVGVTAPVALFPFSGMKDSFFGTLHTQGKEAIRFFTESKVVIQRWF
jgi:malonate-semialdehyde dehydrogenase (acetylating)/methylmalonate-semialdehyde dehydrogenase